MPHTCRFKPRYPKGRPSHMAKEETEADDSTDTPTIGDRVEASEDFSAALDQSVGLVTANRKLLFVLVLASFALLLWLAYPYLVSLLG